MKTFTIVLLVILVILIVACVALYFVGKKAEKKQAEPEKKSSIRAQLKAAKEQTPKKQAKQKTQDLERS